MSSSEDYISKNLELYNTEITQFNTEANLHPTVYGFTPADLVIINADFADWNLKYPAYLAAKTAHATTESEVVASQTSTSGNIRSYIQSYSKKKTATNAGRLALGGNAIGESTPIPTNFDSVPVVGIENGERLQHIVHVRDSVKRKGKPAAALKIALYGIVLDVGAVIPTNIALYTRLGEITKYKMTVRYPSDQGNKVAAYIAIYEGRNNIKSAPSAIASDTILP